MKKIIIKRKFAHVFADIMRFISAVAFVLAIVFFNVNMFIAVIVGLFAIVIVFTYKKTKIVIEQNKICFVNQRFLNLFTNSIEYEPGDIVDFEYFKSSVSILVLLLPIVGAYKNSRIDIIENDGERTKFYIKLKNEEQELIRQFIKRKP